MASLEGLLASRFLRARRRNKLLSFLSITSVVGIMLGVATLITVVSVMDGFTENLKSKFLGSNPDILISNINASPITNWREYINTINKNKEVKGAAPLIIGQAMVSDGKTVTGILVRGIDVDLERKITDIDSSVMHGSIEDLNSKEGEVPSILLGKELAFLNNMLVGKEINLISPTINRGAFGIIPKVKKFKVVGLIDTGIYEHNKSLAYITIKDAQEFFMMDDKVNAVTVIVKDSNKAKDIAYDLQMEINNRDKYALLNFLNNSTTAFDKLGLKSLAFAFAFAYNAALEANLVDYDQPKVWARDWLSMNKSLFMALKLEQFAMFIILTLITIVASFNIVSMITVTVKDKRKEIAIIRAMGGSEKLIRKVFVRQGVIIGLVGTVLGNILALILGIVLKNTEIITIPKEVYHTSTVPILLSPQTFIIVTVCAIIITYIAAIFPARMSAKANPIEAMKND